MATLQLLRSTILIGALALGMACSRAETERAAEEAAARAQSAAARAGDQLADSWLTTKIQAQYFADDDIKARYINVSTRDGVVTLTGRVETAAQREEALQIARNTDGVQRVDDQLTVIGGASPQPVATSGDAPGRPAGELLDRMDDARITASVQAKYFLDDLVKGRHIDVDTRDGVVTLSGTVASEAERAQALSLARTTEGVTRVEDHLSVHLATGAAVGTSGSDPAAAAVDDDALATRIQARFFVDEAVKRADIEVTAKDGVVLLQGTVPSEAARTRALAIARNTNGVVQVVDRLEVRSLR